MATVCLKSDRSQIGRFERSVSKIFGSGDHDSSSPLKPARAAALTVCTVGFCTSGLSQLFFGIIALIFPELVDWLRENSFIFYVAYILLGTVVIGLMVYIGAINRGVTPESPFTLRVWLVCLVWSTALARTVSIIWNSPVSMLISGAFETVGYALPSIYSVIKTKWFAVEVDSLTMNIATVIVIYAVAGTFIAVIVQVQVPQYDAATSLVVAQFFQLAVYMFLLWWTSSK